MSQKRLIALFSTATLLGVLLVAWLATPQKQEDSILPLYEAKQGPLTISVVSGGTIQSRDKVEIKSELEGHNTVIWVIDEGSRVKKGDLLLEFDASTLEEKHKEQKVSVVDKDSALLVTKEKLEITEGDCEAALLDAEIALQLAQMNLDKFNKGDNPKNISQYQSDIALADEELQRAEEKLTWSKKLFGSGYLTRTELQADELAAKRSKIKLDMANIAKQVYDQFTVFKERASLETSLRKAKRALVRTKFQNESKMRQVKSEVTSKELQYVRAKDRLEDLTTQIKKSKITAPVDGVVLYASSVQIARRMWWIQPLRAGGTANERQDLIYIPLESGMVVEVMIPEASLNKLVVNMTASIKIDAIPDRIFTGKLVKIGLLPDGQSAQLSPDLKLYKCEIEFDASDPLIRSGMSCDVELIREQYKDVLSIPMQCVVRIGEESVVYVLDQYNQPMPKPVILGMDNKRQVHVVSGLSQGDKVLLSPPIPESSVTDGAKTEGKAKGKSLAKMPVGKRGK